MLGLGDRQRLIGLFAAALKGETGSTIDQFRELFRLGAEPVAVLQDLLEIGHWLSCLKLDRDAETAFATTPETIAAGKSLADSASLAVLSRAWQVLLKGLDEVRGAPDAATAAEMVLLRLAAMGPLPTPGEVIKRLQQQSPETSANASARRTPGPQEPTTSPAPPPVARIEPLAPRRETGHAGDIRPNLGAIEGHGTSRDPPRSSFVEPADFADLVRLLSLHGEPLLASYLREGAHLVSFQKSRLEMRLAPGLPADLPGRLSNALLTLTGRRWMISLSKSGGEATLAEQEAANRERMIEAIAREASVREVLDAYPGAAIVDIRDGNRRATAHEMAESDPELLEAWPEPRADDNHPFDPDEQLLEGADETDDSRMER
jgi:DNA polymerase-3 subunit gamma/tau